MTTGECIKAARKKADMTQKELGAAIGVSFQTVAQWETGRRKPKYETLRRIAEALEIPLSDLIPGYDKALNDSRGFLLRAFQRGNAQTITAAAQEEYENERAFLMSISNDVFFLNENGHKMLRKYIDFLKTVPEYKKQSTNFGSFEGKDGTTIDDMISMYSYLLNAAVDSLEKQEIIRRKTVGELQGQKPHFDVVLSANGTNTGDTDTKNGGQ